MLAGIGEGDEAADQATGRGTIYHFNNADYWKLLIEFNVLVRYALYDWKVKNFNATLGKQRGTCKLPLYCINALLYPLEYLTNNLEITNISFYITNKPTFNF